MLLDEFGTLHEIRLPISLHEVLAHTLNIVDDDQLDIFLLNSLGEIQEYFIVILYVLAEMHYNVLSDSGLSDCGLMFDQEVVLHLIETLLVQVLARDHKQRLAP
jgi:hypothetical protein